MFWVRGGGGGLIRPPRLNSGDIKAMTTKLGGQIIRPRMFSLRSQHKLMTSYDVTITSGSKMTAILDPVKI